VQALLIIFVKQVFLTLHPSFAQVRDLDKNITALQGQYKQIFNSVIHILSTFTHLHINPNQYDLHSSVKHNSKFHEMAGHFTF